MNTAAEGGNPAVSGKEASSARTTDRLAEKAHAAVDRAAHTASEAEENVRATASKAAERARQSEEQVEAQVREGVDRVRAYVEQNPLASAGIAFVAGLIVSSLMRR
jgi:ElaB/YqjD/DUF883 family membrane-anchored ribosome-binding protein